MTFKEYCNQEEVKRRIGITVSDKDILRSYSSGVKGYYNVVLRMNDIEYTYTLTVSSDILFVPDIYGNPRRSSCFIYVGTKLREDG